MTKDDLLQLEVHLDMIHGWADRVPATTEFFFIDWQPLLVLPRVPGLTKEELSIAAYLQPLHSQLCAIAVQVLWKADQFIRTLCNALNAGDLIVGATMARSLIETAASFGCETHSITTIWKERKAQPAADLNSLADFHQNAVKVIAQILFGTKLEKNKEPVTGVSRTNILTLIDKAGKLSEHRGIRKLYDILCDTVHPSIGSNRCFWTKEPSSKDGPIRRFVASRNAPSILGNLPFAIGKTTIWSLQWLGHMWVLLERTRNDLCLTANIYALPYKYYGIVSPGDPSGYCRCGSGQQEEECNHKFGSN
ncbi:MAG: hypothetical protein AABO41_02900 [Acidobacteriota bacterium]